MRSQSQGTNIKRGDLAQMTDDVVNFYRMYGPTDPGFLSGEPVLVLETSQGRAQVLDSLGNTYSTSLLKIRRL